jgi:membrane fusion protein (multidrug efflux system)
MKTSTKGAVLAGVAVILVGGFYLLNQKESDAAFQTTEDAYLKADLTAVSPKISAEIVEVKVQDYQAVAKGELLILLDDRALSLALETAKANAHQASARIHELQAQLALQQQVIISAKAKVAADKANYKQAAVDAKRFANLAASGSGTVLDKENAETQKAILKANLDQNTSDLASEQEKISVLNASLESAKAQLESANAALDNAKLNVSYTQITSPVDGYIAHSEARLGQFAKTGTPIITVVPNDVPYIDAQFRETQLTHVQVGQKATVVVDAYPDQTFNARVTQLAPASGAALSSIPSHSASGNFTKIVQRLPVRIELEDAALNKSFLRLGMSATVTIDTESTKAATQELSLK